MSRRSGGRVRAAVPGLLATLIAVAAMLAPAGVRPVAGGSGGLRVASDATYSLDPGAGRVRVAVRFRVTNLDAPTPSVVYFYRAFAFGVQAEARAIRAADGTGALSVDATRRRDFTEVEVRLRANLFYRQTATFTVRYDLVGGAPRSASPIRVGAAFATFGVWAWGDPGRGTVEVRTPPGFGSRIDGAEMDIENAPTGQTLRAEPPDPEQFYAIVSAENRAAYQSTRLSLPGDVEIVVLAWPEDDVWDETVSDTLRAGVPELLELIDLDWPVERDLNVRERYTPALEGYAGVFFVDEQRIDVSEDLDPVVIMHEASHAWFNGDLFSDRWVYEGLAEEYAFRVQSAVGGEPGEAATRPDLDDPGRIALSGWEFPEVIRDQETDDRERYGYEAAYWVVHEIVREAGIERMQAAFAAAQANETAYRGAGVPETVSAADSWRRLLDLAEPVEAPESAAIEAALRDFVLPAGGAAALADRRAARGAYRELLEAGDGWLPGWYLRQPMGEWRFDLATERIERFARVLAVREQVATAAGALGLTPNGALRVAYEQALNGLDEAEAIGRRQLAALAAVAAARAKVEASPDIVASIGLIGETPKARYEAARAAFERGDLEATLSEAARAGAVVDGASAVGELRLLLGTVVAIGLVALVMVAATLSRRGRRPPTGPAPAVPAATLAGDPAAAPAPPGATPPEVEGGPARGEPPPDP